MRCAVGVVGPNHVRKRLGGPAKRKVRNDDLVVLAKPQHRRPSPCWVFDRRACGVRHQFLPVAWHHQRWLDIAVTVQGGDGNVPVAITTLNRLHAGFFAVPEFDRLANRRHVVPDVQRVAWRDGDAVTHSAAHRREINGAGELAVLQATVNSLRERYLQWD